MLSVTRPRQPSSSLGLGIAPGPAGQPVTTWKRERHVDASVVNLPAMKPEPPVACISDVLTAHLRSSLTCQENFGHVLLLVSGFSQCYVCMCFGIKYPERDDENTLSYKPSPSPSPRILAPPSGVPYDVLIGFAIHYPLQRHRLTFRVISGSAELDISLGVPGIRDRL